MEFASAEVAEIAAEAMHNYMMFGQRLVCRVVPADQQHPNLWKGANRSACVGGAGSRRNPREAQSGVSVRRFV